MVIVKGQAKIDQRFIFFFEFTSLDKAKQVRLRTLR